MGAEGESTESGGVEEVLINVRCSNGTKLAVRASLESLVVEFKEIVAQNCDVPAVQQRLIYKGKILKDDQTLQSYGLQAEHTVHMVRGFNPSGSTSTTPVNAPASVNSNNASVAPGATLGAGGATGGAGLGASLFPGADFNFLGGNGNLGDGIPGLQQMQQQLTQNPNLMREIMNTPAMQSLMNNPDLMRNMIMNNPQTREIIDRNPELAHVLNDPNIIRQTIETARNPELMREMMRNTDRAMSNIESSPEGFNMLRRLYENVQEPFLNATTGGIGNDTALNPFAALLGNQGGGGAPTGPNVPNNDTAGAVPNANPLPNPWGPPQTNTASRTTSNAPATAGIGGLGGLGLPDLNGLTGGMPDAALVNQMLQNPAMSQMMQSVLSNPQYMNQLLNLNPQMRTLLDSNPQLREMMQNPEFLRQLSSPETMQQMMTLQQSLLPLLNQPQGAGGGRQTGDAAGLEMLMNMFGGLGTGGLNVPNTPAVPPEELYATQLGQLQEMGFFDTQENIRALQATLGNVNAAVERLLNNLG